MNTQELKAALAKYYGSETFYRHSLNRRMLYTEGVQAFAEYASAYWFIDIAATELFALQKDEEFLSIVLHVEGTKARMIVEDGNGNVLFTTPIKYTDCPEGKWKFFFADNVLMLPSEY